MRITVVIPVLNEEKTIAATLAALTASAPDEVIAVDGGSNDRTRAIIEQTSARLLSSPRGRARQMNRGAKEARGDVIVFLHADTRLPSSAVEDIRAALSDPGCIGGRFDVELEGDHWALKWIGALISLRSRLTKVAIRAQEGL
ncbi:MAG: glycosyltransferase [Deltaproteobacteria bacterium]|nr:glycosyltransferase [Deltaproteobacteria bacterium]